MLLVFLGVYAGGLWVMRPAEPGQQVSYDGLVAAAEDGRVATARFLDEDARVVGELATAEGTRRFHTTYPASDAATSELLATLAENGAQVAVEAQTIKGLVRFVTQFLLPLVILANLFALFFQFRSGGDDQQGATSEFRLFASMGNKLARTPKRGRAQTRFGDVAAADEAIAEVADVRDYLADPKAVQAMGASPPKGVLLRGPPGSGKTLLAKAVAGEADAAFFSVSGSEFVESLVGVGAARVRDLFAQARRQAPAIVFVDELDAVGRQRGAGLGGGHDEREQTLNELLVQMDGFSASEGVVVIAATNRPDILDPALLRPGRFDRQVTIDRPDADGRLAILRLHAQGKQLADAERDLPAVAAATPGFSGADLASVLNEAALLAVRQRAATIGDELLDEAVERVVAGARQQTTRYSPRDRQRLAYHEAGHVVVAAALGKADRVDKVSIVARGKGVGHLSMLGDDTAFPTRGDLEARMTVALGGLVAEQQALGDVSVGSEDDVQRATRLAKDLAGRYGMSDRLGRARLLAGDGQVFLGRDYLATAEVSQPTLHELDDEVRQLLAAQEHTASDILAEHATVLGELADALATHETLKGGVLHDYLARIVAQPTATPPASGNGTPAHAGQTPTQPGRATRRQ
jgi:cell division protease FtsH